MSRDTTLPAGVQTAATSPVYGARHAVRLALPTPLCLCESPGPLTINGEVYTDGVLAVGDVSVGPLPSMTLKLVNGNNEISSQDADNNALRETVVVVYEVTWDPSTGVQNDPVVLFTGVVNQVSYTATGANLQCTARVPSTATAGMVGRYVSRLCSHMFREARCGASAGWAVFSRGSVATKQDGSDVSANAPRYETAKFNHGITIEEGCWNMVDQASSDFEAGGGGSVGNWAAYGDSASINAHNGGAYHGSYCLHVTCSAGGEGAVMQGIANPNIYSMTITVSARVRGASAGGSMTLVLEATHNGTTNMVRETVAFTLTTGFQRIKLPITTYTDSNTLKVYVVQDGSHSDSLEYYVDCLQVEPMPYATTWAIGWVGNRSAETLVLSQAQIIDVSEGTFEAWISLLRSPGTQPQYVYDLNGKMYQSVKLYVGTGGRLTVVYGNGAGDTTIEGNVATLVEGTLYHVAVTWSPSGVAIYVNGVSEGSSSNVPSLVQSAASMYIGSRSDGGLQLDGVIDDVRFENNARSAGDVADDYASATALSVTSHTNAKLSFDDTLVAECADNLGPQKCDRTMATCATLGNLARYGGWPSMPAIGTIFSYKVANGTTLIGTAGTYAPTPYVSPPPTVLPGRILRGVQVPVTRPIGGGVLKGKEVPPTRRIGGPT